MITNKHLAMVADELKKAKQKHPFFAHRFISDEEMPVLQNSIATQLSAARAAVRITLEYGDLWARDVLECEFLEAQEAYARGNYKECLQELAQCAAVVFRIMDMVAEKRKEKEIKDEQANCD